MADNLCIDSHARPDAHTRHSQLPPDKYLDRDKPPAIPCVDMTAQTATMEWAHARATSRDAAAVDSPHSGAAIAVHPARDRSITQLGSTAISARVIIDCIGRNGHGIAGARLTMLRSSKTNGCGSRFDRIAFELLPLLPQTSAALPSRKTITPTPVIRGSAGRLAHPTTVGRTSHTLP